MFKILFIINVIMIAVFSLQPGSGHQMGQWDKVAHFISYASLCLFYFLGFGMHSKKQTNKVLIGIILFGVAIELIQYFIPLRQFSLLDVCANTLGALTALWLFKLFFYKKSVQ